MWQILTPIVQNFRVKFVKSAAQELHSTISEDASFWTLSADNMTSHLEFVKLATSDMLSIKLLHA
jgi:hypothetical protein